MPGGAAASQRIPDYDLEVPASQPYSQPYWLVKPPQAAAYTVDNQLLIGLPESPVERMRIRLTVAGTPIELVRPVLYRYNDRLEGEKVRPLTVVPPVAVNLPLSPDDIANQVLLFPRQAARNLRVTVKAEVANAEGSQRVDVPTDRKSTRLNSSHLGISYAVFCLKKKQTTAEPPTTPLTVGASPRCESTRL